VWDPGTNIIQRDDVPTVFVPPTLTYIFMSEMPVLLEGSILKNLLLGAKQVRDPRDTCSWWEEEQDEQDEQEGQCFNHRRSTEKSHLRHLAGKCRP